MSDDYQRLEVDWGLNKSGTVPTSKLATIVSDWLDISYDAAKSRVYRATESGDLETVRIAGQKRITIKSAEPWLYNNA